MHVALDLGLKGQHGPTELSAALYHLKSVGMDNVHAMDALTQAEKLASVGGSNLEATTNAVAGAYKSGISGAQNFKQAVGTLNSIIGAGNLRMEDLNSALGTGFLVTAKTFGISLSSVGSALAFMTSRGIPAVKAATAPLIRHLDQLKQRVRIVVDKTATELLAFRDATAEIKIEIPVPAVVASLPAPVPT